MIIEYSVVFIFFLILFSIGILASKKIHSISDYYVGGKKMGYWVAAFSSRATGESSWLLLGLTGLGATIGVSAFWVVIGEVIGVFIAWFFMAEKFKLETDKYDSLTIPDYLVSRFKRHNKLIRIISATALTVFVTIYVSAQIDATGKAFESFLGWDKLFADFGPNAGYYFGSFIGFGIVIIYTFSGGFIAVAWSDVFQGLLMLIGLIALPIVAWLSISGGLFSSLQAISPDLVNIWGKGGANISNIFIVISFLVIGIGYLGSPQMFVRLMSVKNINEIKKGRWVALIYTILADTGAVLVGIGGRVYFQQLTGTDAMATLGATGEAVLPLLVKALFPSIIVGLYIATVLSAIMSTVDSLLVLASSAVTRDFYQKTFHPDYPDNKLTAMSRKVTLGIALIALGIAMSVAWFVPERTIFWFVIFGWSGIAATFCPVIILALFSEKFNAEGAIAAMVTGFLCIPVFKFIIPYKSTINEITHYTFGNFGLYTSKLGELFPSFVIAIIVGYVVSRFTQKYNE